ETKRDSRFSKKMINGAIHQPTSCKTWAKVAIVRSSCVGTEVSQGCMRSLYALIFQNLSRDHQPLNLARSFANGAQLHVAVKLFRWIILNESIATVNLYPFICDSNSDFAGVELRHGRLQSSLHAGVFHRGGSIGEHSGRINFRRHVRQFPLDCLKVADRASKLFALLGIFERRFVRTLRHTQPEGGNRNAPAVQDLHSINEAVPFFAE